MGLQQSEIQENENQTVQYREFKGANLTDVRTGIEDGEWAWLENGMPVGKGNLKLVPGPGATITNAALTGIFNIWGFTLNGVPVLIAIKSDGSVAQVNLNTNAVTVVAAAGSVTTSVRLTIWQSTTILFIDPTKGYLSWDGATFATIDAARKGSAIATFEGRAWIVGVQPSRTITFTSPNTFNDFTGANGSGSVTISDSAFPGSITNLISALEQLWIVGPGAVESITNVSTQGTPLVTTFSLTNVVSNVGSIFPSSVSSFLRTIVFQTPYGVYAIIGATPQKMSDKLDGLYPNLSLGSDEPAAVGTVHNVFIWCVLTTFVDPGSGIGSSGTAGNRSMLLCFSQGKWFFASAGSIIWVTSAIVNGSPEIWATTGTGVFQMFADSTNPVNYILTTKLFDFGDSTQIKELNRVGLEITSPNIVQPTLTIQNETAGNNSVPVVVGANQINWTGLNGAPLIFTGLGGAPIVWVVSGLQLFRTGRFSQFGDYLGLTLSGTEAVWTLSAIALEIRPGGKWNAVT